MEYSASCVNRHRGRPAYLERVTLESPIHWDGLAVSVKSVKHRSHIHHRNVPVDLCPLIWQIVYFERNFLIAWIIVGLSARWWVSLSTS